MISDQSDLLFRPASTLSKYSIFDYEININDVMKGIATDQITTDKFENGKVVKGQKQIKEYDYNEMKKAIDFVIAGDFKLPYNDFLYQRGLSIKQLRNKKTIMYFHDKIDFEISINQQKGFPKLKKGFIADAIKLFDKPEVRDFDSDKEFVRGGLSFFNKYGTHFLNKTKYGSRFLWISELNLTKWDNQPSKDTSNETTHFKSGTIALEFIRDKKNDRLGAFEISSELGNCEIDMLENKMDKCNASLSNVGLLGFEVEYLYRVFDAEKIKAPILQPDNSPLSADRLKNIFVNMKNLLDALTSSVDIRNPYISDLITYNNFRLDYGDAIPCTKNYKIKRFGDILNSLYYYDIVDKRFMPVFLLNRSNKRNHHNFNILSIDRFETLICNMKERLYNIGIIDSPYLFNKKYLTDIRFFSINDFSPANVNFNKTIGYDLKDCQNFWVGKKFNSAVINSNITTTDNDLYLICFKYASLFLDKNIITDIKIKYFTNDDCKNFIYNSKNYQCLCDQDVVALTKKEPVVPNNPTDGDKSKKPKTKKTFICFARKIMTD